MKECQRFKNINFSESAAIAKRIAVLETREERQKAINAIECEIRRNHVKELLTLAYKARKNGFSLLGLPAHDRKDAKRDAKPDD